MSAPEPSQRITTDVQRAASTLRGGGVVAFGTETVYGLGANALDPAAVARVFEIKGRPRFDPLIVHVPTPEAVRELVCDFPATAARLAARFWPGPLTLVLPKRAHVPDIVTSGLPSVAVRVPSHPVALALLRAAGVPIAAPSANTFGQISPTTAEHVARDLGGKIDLILEGGPCETGVESTIVSLAEDHPALLRLGGVPLEEIAAITGPLATPDAKARRVLAPGMLERHYAPTTPMRLLDASEDESAAIAASTPKLIGWIALGRPRDVKRYTRVEALSPTGSLREAAANLFAAMHRLDEAGLDLIIARRVPDEGLGRAINDRLRRASAKASEAEPR